jgi:hypothetical protein
MPPRLGYYQIRGEIYEIMVYDVIHPVDVQDAMPFSQGAGYVTIRPVVSPVVAVRPESPGSPLSGLADKK